MNLDAPDGLDQARQDAGMSHEQLWLRYFGLGGMNPALEVEAVLQGLLQTSAIDHNRLVHALNERFTQLGRNHPVPYADAGRQP